MLCLVLAGSSLRRKGGTDCLGTMRRRRGARLARGGSGSSQSKVKSAADWSTVRS